MATYLNDLRLTELATGEGSGTWGTTTNTSLELIGEALGFATQQVFGSDADATTTIADGASDPARAMYFKITSAGSLTATRTCTIAPNTISRVMFIENATTGSQSIQISQGSGASVTILAGKTAVVYLDGAGAGAAVVDAMAGVDPGVTDTLAEVLAAGNTSGANNLIIDNGQAITTNTINETTAASGVTIDSVLLKDDGVNATNLEITNLKANDGTSAGSIADSTGVVTLASSVFDHRRYQWRNHRWHNLRSHHPRKCCSHHRQLQLYARRHRSSHILLNSSRSLQRHLRSHHPRKCRGYYAEYYWYCYFWW
jgi:hypothetical protein